METVKTIALEILQNNPVQANKPLDKIKAALLKNLMEQYIKSL